MFDSYLIREDSLENTVEDGKITGFKFAVRIADYRGCFLSLHNGYYIECDDVVYPRELQKFEINGKAPRDFNEIKKLVSGSTGTMMMKLMFMLQKRVALLPANISLNCNSQSFLNMATCHGMKSGLKTRPYREMVPVLERLHLSVLSH